MGKTGLYIDAFTPAKTDVYAVYSVYLLLGKSNGNRIHECIPIKDVSRLENT